MTLIIRIAIIAGALAASGCVGGLLETNPPKPRYMIGGVSGEALAGEPVGWSLVVEDPSASRAYDTTKLAVSRSPGRIEYFGGGEWAGRAPRVFQTALIESFEDSGRILEVGDRRALPVADFVLQTDLRRIDLDVSNGDYIARLSVYARLGDGRRRIHAARVFSASQAARSGSGDAVAAAFDEAFDAVITEIAVWTFDAGAEAQADRVADAGA